MHPVIKKDKRGGEGERKERGRACTWLPRKMNAYFDPLPLPCSLFVFYLSLYFTLSHISSVTLSHLLSPVVFLLPSSVLFPSGTLGFAPPQSAIY